MVELTQKSLMDRIKGLLTDLVRLVEVENAAGSFDINTHAEYFLIPLLSAVYDYRNLKNLNVHSGTFPGVDLGDEQSRVTIQVTSTNSREKLIHTLQQFVKHKHYEQYDRLILYLLSEKYPNGYDVKNVSKAIDTAKREIASVAPEHPFDFDIKKDIINHGDLVRKIRGLNLDDIQEVLDILEKNIRSRSSQRLDGMTEYLEALVAKHSGMDFIGMETRQSKEFTSLEDIFVLPNAIEYDPKNEDEARRSGVGSKAVEVVAWILLSTYLSSKGKSTQIGTFPLNKMVLLGAPGAGKTTLLKQSLIAAAKNSTDNSASQLPVYIPLKDLGQAIDRPADEFNFPRFLQEYANNQLLLNLEENFFESALQKDSCTVCLDGLDEVRSLSLRKKIIDLVSYTAKKFPGNDYILTSRLAGYDQAPLNSESFLHLQLTPFDDEQIGAFISKWYEKNEADAKAARARSADLSETIFSGEQPELVELARNPLLLTIIALIHKEEAELPNERGLLYEKCIVTLLEKWDLQKGISSEDPESLLAKHKTGLLERLAYKMHENGVLEIKKGDLSTTVAKSLVEITPNVSKSEAQHLAKAFIDHIRLRSGLLVEKSEGHFAFVHQTFQEYLAAKDIENRKMIEGKESLWAEIQEYLYLPHWLETLLLLFGNLRAHEGAVSYLVSELLAQGNGNPIDQILGRHLIFAAHVLADNPSIDSVQQDHIIEGMTAMVARGPSDTYGVSLRSVFLSTLQQDALEILGKLKQNNKAGEALLALFQNEGIDRHSRAAALWVLCGLGWKKNRVMEVVLKTIRRAKSREALWRTAIFGLVRLDHPKDETIDTLLQLLKDSSGNAARQKILAEILAAINATESIEDLHSILEASSVDASVQKEVARALGSLGESDTAISALQQIARDQNVEINTKESAIASMMAIAKTDPELVAPLLPLLRDMALPAKLRMRMASWLLDTQFEADATEVLHEIALEDPEDDIRISCVDQLTLHRPGKNNSELLDQVSQDQFLGIDARRRLAQLQFDNGRHEEAERQLRRLLNDNYLRIPEEQQRLAATCARVGLAQEALDLFLEVIRVSPQRNQAAKAFGRLHKKLRAANQLDKLRDLANNDQESMEVRLEGSAVLAHLGGDQEAIDYLASVGMSSDVPPGIRLAAAEHLGALGKTNSAVEIILSVNNNRSARAVFLPISIYGSLKKVIGDGQT